MRCLREEGMVVNENENETAPSILSSAGTSLSHSSSSYLYTLGAWMIEVPIVQRDRCRWLSMTWGTVNSNHHHVHNR